MTSTSRKIVSDYVSFFVIFTVLATIAAWGNGVHVNRWWLLTVGAFCIGRMFQQWVEEPR